MNHRIPGRIRCSDLPAQVAARALLALGAGALSCGTGADPSQGGAVVAVQVDANYENDNVGGNGNNSYTQAFALGVGADYAAFAGTLVRMEFDGSGATSGAYFSNAATLDLDVASNDGSVWWVGAGVNMGSCTLTGQGGQAFGLWTSSDSGFLATSGAAAPAAQFCSSSSAQAQGTAGVFGLAVDARWAFVAVAFTTQVSGTGYVPDEQGWPGPSPQLAPGSGARLLRFDRQNLGASPVALGGVTQLANAVTSHVVSQNTLEVYWLDASASGGDRVMRAAKDAWTTGQVLGTAAANTLTGLAADDQVAVWTVSGPPLPGATGCTVFSSQADGPPVKIYEGQAAPFLCWGAAVDGEYAYFATAQIAPQTSNGGEGNGGTYLQGTGIARVPLAGGALQTVSLSSPRWYGPRRVKVDSQYVYAIDPSFVARVDKSAFGP